MASGRYTKQNHSGLTLGAKPKVKPYPSQPEIDLINKAIAALQVSKTQTTQCGFIAKTGDAAIYIRRLAGLGN